MKKKIIACCEINCSQNPMDAIRAPRYHKKRVSGSWDRLKFENLRLVGTCVERKKCLSSTGLSLLYVFLFHSCWIVQHTQAILFVFFSRRHESIFALFRRKDVQFLG